jgi:hypothetical protein
MRYPIAIAFALVVIPAALSAQTMGQEKNELAMRVLTEGRRVFILPNEVMGFRITGETGEVRNLRVSTGHLAEGHLYHAIATVTPRDGSAALRTEGTLDINTPSLSLGALADGEYLISIKLTDLTDGSTRDATNRVVLR